MTNAPEVRLGLRENAAQFALLVGVNAFVGAMIGLERSTLPVIGEQDFGLASSTAILSFVAAFGASKALTNLGAGALAERLGRRRLLVAGWALALPVPVLIATAPSWSVIVAANVLLGVQQGLTWSMTVLMKVDLVGPRRRGLALGLNESVGYGGVALAAAAAGVAAGALGPRTVIAVGGAAIAVIGLALSVLFVRDTAPHVALEQSHSDPAGRESPPSLAGAFAASSFRDAGLRSCSQAGFVNNAGDALAWGLVPLYLAANGASLSEIGLVAGIYPAVWGIGQVPAGALSDRVGRKPLIVAGMLLQAVALAGLAASGGAVTSAALAAAGLGAGTALVYPTLIAAAADRVSAVARAPVLGVYRFWRDAGYVGGAVLAGLAADSLGYAAAIAVLAGVTAVSSAWVAVDMPPDRRVGSGSRGAGPAGARATPA